MPSLETTLHLWIEALEAIGKESHDDYCRWANCVLAQLECFETYFGLKLSYFVFSPSATTVQEHNSA